MLGGDLDLRARDTSGCRIHRFDDADDVVLGRGIPRLYEQRGRPGGGARAGEPGSFVYTREFGLSPTGFSLAFAINAVGFFGASQLAGMLSARLGMERLIAYAISGFAAATLLLAALGWAGLATLPVVVGGLFIANADLGLVLPTTMAMAMDPHPDIAGLAASLGGTVQMMTGGVMIAMTGLQVENSAASMLRVIALCGVLAWLAAAAALTGRIASPDQAA